MNEAELVDFCYGLFIANGITDVSFDDLPSKTKAAVCWIGMELDCGGMTKDAAGRGLKILLTDWIPER